MERYLPLLWTITISLYGSGEGSEAVVTQASITLEFYDLGGYEIGVYSTEQWDESFPNLSADQRNQMCVDAKNYAQIDGHNVVADARMYYTFIPRSSYNASRVALIKCLTLPVSYLRVTRPYDEYVVVMEVNKYLTDSDGTGRSPYTINTERINSDPIPCADFVRKLPKYTGLSGRDLFKTTILECRHNDFLKNNALSKMPMFERLNLCFAAKRITGNLVELLTDEIEEARIVYIGGANAEAERVVAIACDSYPPMHVAFKDARTLRVFMPEDIGN